MKRYSVLLITVFFIIGLLFVYGCSKQEPVKPKLTIGYSALRISLPVFVAEKKGLFKKHGLDVQLQKYETAQPMMDALVSGGIDVGGYCALPITFSAMVRSKTPLLFLTAMMEDENHLISMLIVKKNSGISTIKQLKGKRIGILPTRAYEVWLQLILEKNGVSPNDVIIQQIAPNLQASALASGSVAALFTNDPAATASLVKGFGELLVEEALVPKYTYSPFYFGSFNVTKKFADTNPDMLKKIASALDEAIEFINNNPTEAKSFMAEFINKELEPLSTKYPDAYYKKSGEVTNDELNKYLKYYLDSKIIPETIDLTNSQYNIK